MKIIIASHGSYSEGILSSLQVIFGENLPHGVNTYSLNVGEDVNILAEQISKDINDNELTIILTDLMGGSVDNALFPLIHNKNIKIIAGINLVFLLELMTLTNDEQIDENINTIIERSKEGIVSKNKIFKELNEQNDSNDNLDN